MVAPRADALTNRTTTYSALSAASDPSELGSEPDSWLLLRYLRSHERSGRCAREQRLAAAHRTGSGARPEEKDRAAAKTSALVASRFDVLMDRTTTYRLLSFVSDPSELGSEPDSWLVPRLLRAHGRSGWCVRDQRAGSNASKRQKSTASRRNRQQTVPQHKLVRSWRRVSTHSRTGPQRTEN